MSCFIKIAGKEYTKEEFESSLSNPSFIKQLEAEYSNSQEEYENSSVKIGQFAKYVQFKNSLIGQLENRLAKIKVAKKSTTNKEDLKKLIKLENEIEFQLNGNDKVKGLNQQVESLNRNKDINAIGYYAERDLERLNSLSKSTDPDDLKEARKIVNFYTSVGTFDAAKEHPIFTFDEMFNEDGSYALSDTIRFQFEDWKNRALEKNNEIVTNEKSFIEETLNSNPKVKEMYDKLTYDKLNTPMADVSWVDMMLMDISNGIFSSNGILPQVMLDVTQKQFEKQMVDVKKFEDNLNKMLPAVEKELTNLGYTMKGLGILGVKGVSYDLFKQLDADGKQTGSLAIRYSQEYYDKLHEFNVAFHTSLSRARKDENLDKILSAYNFRNNWYRKNTLMMNIDLIPELNPNAAIDNPHVKELKSLLGEKGYREEVAKQKEQIDKWNTDFEVWKELYAEERGISKADFTDENINEIEIYEKQNSPLHGIQTYNQNHALTQDNLIVFNNFKYNVVIPRKVKSINSLSPNGSISFKDSKESTGFYDKNFEKIEANKTLADFHELMIEQTKLIRSKLPAEAQKKMRINSLPGVRKNIAEILMDKNVGFFKGLSIAAKEIYDRIRLGFGVNIQSNISNAAIDVATGKPDYQVSDTFLGNNKAEIKRLSQVESIKFSQTLKIPKKIDKHTTLQEKHLTPRSIELLAEYLNTSPNIQSVLAKTGKYIKIGEIIERFNTDKVVQEQSFDLPKVMKYYSAMAAEYIARNELLPMMEVMKSHYTEIKKTATNNVNDAILNGSNKETRTEGLRTNAIKQIDNWFDRVILGNYGSKEAGVKRGISKYSGTTTSVKERSKEFFSDMSAGKLLSSKEKEFRREINKLIEQETNEEKINELKSVRDELGKNFAISAAFESVLNYVRFLGLGYNLSSSITNFIEGQSANFIIAASGDYFKPEDYYRALDIAKGSFLKNITFGKIQTEGAKKNRTLMDKYKIIQDSTNELQKASSKSAISGIQKYTPYALTQRVEFLNQSPLMIAIALNTNITGINGEIQNLWDAMNPDGTLKAEFRTPENIANWENGDGDAYREFKIKVGKAIDTAHGNYESLRGMMAKSSVLGKAVLMFKSWIGRAAYTRFAKPQDDLQAGVKGYKGRYWSHTPITATLQGALVGLAGAGAIGTGIGAVVGLGFGSFFGAKSSIGMVQELVFNAKTLFRKALGNPINVIAGKNIIETHPNFDSFVGDKFTKRDAVNMQANLTDMSLLLSWIALTLIVKAAFWDDEDEEDDPQRLIHNGLVNRLMQLTSQSNMFLNPSELYSNTIGDLSVLGFFDNVGKTMVEVNDYLQGYDVIPTGINAGESALYNQVQKTFYPSIVRDVPSFGLEKQAERQFTPSPFDNWFWSDEKHQEKIIKSKRASRKRELREQYEDSGLAEDLVAKQINKIVNRELPLH